MINASVSAQGTDIPQNVLEALLPFAQGAVDAILAHAQAYATVASRMRTELDPPPTKVTCERNGGRVTTTFSRETPDGWRHVYWHLDARDISRVLPVDGSVVRMQHAWRNVMSGSDALGR